MVCIMSPQTKHNNSFLWGYRKYHNNHYVWYEIIREREHMHDGNSLHAERCVLIGSAGGHSFFFLAAMK